MTLALWVLVLLLALFALVKGADYFVDGAKALGKCLGMSSFAIGVIIVGFGTSMPELATSIAAVLNNASEISVANAIGSNITNILLVVGMLTVVGGRTIIKRDLIKSELPIYGLSVAIFTLAAIDGTIDQVESVLLFGSFLAYCWYLFNEAEQEDKVDIVRESGRCPNFTFASISALLGGLVAVIVGAQVAVYAVVSIATGLSIPVDIVTITAVALGTSLPELTVSLRAVARGKSEIAIGNIFGSNAFNLLIAIGLPGMFVPLSVGVISAAVGLPFLVAVSVIFFINGLSRSVLRWEGIVFLLFFLVFLAKLLLLV